MKQLFSALASALPDGVVATLVIKNTAGGRMSVCTSFNDDKGALSGELTPFVLKGTPDEMDEGFVSAIAEPAETVRGLVSNIAQFRKAAEQAEKNASKAAATKTSPAKPATDAAAKLIAEQKRREAEKKAKEANYGKTMDEVKKESASGNYFTAQALLKLASTLTDDKKVKSDLDKQVKQLGGMTGGFLCNDSEEASQKALDEFKKGLATAEMFLENTGGSPETKTVPAEEPDAGDDADIPEDTDTKEEE